MSKCSISNNQLKIVKTAFNKAKKELIDYNTDSFITDVTNPTTNIQDNNVQILKDRILSYKYIDDLIDAAKLCDGSSCISVTDILSHIFKNTKYEHYRLSISTAVKTDSYEIRKVSHKALLVFINNKPYTIDFKQVDYMINSKPKVPEKGTDEYYYWLHEPMVEYFMEEEGMSFKEAFLKRAPYDLSLTDDNVMKYLRIIPIEDNPDIDDPAKIDFAQNIDKSDKIKLLKRLERFKKKKIKEDINTISPGSVIKINTKNNKSVIGIIVDYSKNIYKIINLKTNKLSEVNHSELIKLPFKIIKKVAPKIERGINTYTIKGKEQTRTYSIKGVSHVKYNNKEMGSSWVKSMGTKQEEILLETEEDVKDFLATLDETMTPTEKSILEKVSKGIKTIFKVGEKLKVITYINKTFNRGSAVLEKTLIRLSSGSKLSLQTEKEIFLHEMTHLMTHTALSVDAKLRTRLLQLQQAVIKHLDNNPEIDPETFFIPIGVEHTDEAKRQSKEMYRYIKGDPEEFFTIATTNNILNNYIKNNDIKVSNLEIEGIIPKNGIERLLDLVIKAFNQIIMNMTKKPASKELNDIFATAILLTEKMANNTYSETPLLEKLKIAQLFRELNKLKGVKEILNGVKSSVKLVMQGVDNTLKHIEDKVKDPEMLARIAKENAKAIARFNLDIAGLIRDVYNEMFRDNILDSKFYELYNKIKHMQETVRMQQESANIELLDSLLPDSLKTPNKLKRLTKAILMTDLAIIPINRLKRYILVKPARDNRIAILEKRIMEHPYGRAMINQTKALAYYMLTGEVTVEHLQLNANGIAKQLFILEESDRHITEDLSKEIDELATLYSINYLDGKSLEVLITYVEEDEENFSKMIKYIRNTIKKDTLTLFPNPVHVIKGYIKPKSKSLYESAVIDASKLELYKSHGWEVDYTINGENGLLKNTIGTSYVMKRLNTEPAYTKGAFEITNQSTMGLKLSDEYIDNPEKYREEILKNIKNKLSVINTNENFNPKEVAEELKERKETKVVPLYNEDGEVVDYRYVLRKDHEAELNNHDLDIRSVISNTQSHMFLKINGTEINKQLIDYFLGSWDRSKPHLYTYIGVDPVSGEILNPDLYAILPKATKEYLGNKLLPIPTHLIKNTMGYKDPTLYNHWLLKNVTNKNINKIRRKIQLFEKLWKDFIKLVKPLMVIANGAVLLGNLMSNFWVLSQYMPIEKVFREMKKNWIEYDKLNKEYNEMRKLESKEKAKIITTKERIKLKHLRNSISKNKLNSLVESGIVGSIIEDATISNINDTNLISNFIEKKYISKLKPEAQSIVKTLFITEDTALFKKALKIMQYGDVVAKKTLMDYYILKEHKSEKEALLLADQYFINYNLNQNEYLKYANDTGMFMFSKFLLGTVKVIKNTIKMKPLGVAKLGSINELLIDVPEIYETYTHTPTDLIAARQIHFFDEAENLMDPFSRINRLFSY